MILAPGVFIAGVVIFLIVLWDAFEAIILPRRVTRKFRLARFYYQFTWTTWKIYARLIPSKKGRESFLGFYGPISLLFLIAVWAAGLILSFAMMQYGAGSAVNLSGDYAQLLHGLVSERHHVLHARPGRRGSALGCFTFSGGGGIRFWLRLSCRGDRVLPFVYGSFADRETEIVLLDARAGTPPTAGELLLRHTFPGGHEALRDLFKDWERWSAQLLESHLSYPVLAYFRSQHDNQSWISSLTAILDACALTISGMEDVCARQAQLTFAIARHAVADLCQVFSVVPRPPDKDRLPPDVLQLIRETLAKHGTKLAATPEADQKLAELRNLYEPYVYGLRNASISSLPALDPCKKIEGQLADHGVGEDYERHSGGCAGSRRSFLNRHFLFPFWARPQSPISCCCLTRR